MDGRAAYFEFISTPTFESAAKKLLTEEDRRHLESLLLANPVNGKLLERTGGFRKVRFARPSRREGKSGGIRVVYFAVEKAERIYLILVYSKNAKDDLTRAEEKEFRKLSQVLRREGD